MIEERQCSEYDRLPESIKAIYSYKQWLWLSRPEKDSLVVRETEPEVE